MGSDTPLLLASNFDGTSPGLVGLLNTGACLTSLGATHTRLWSAAANLAADEWFMAALEGWVRDGTVDHDDSFITPAPARCRRRRRLGRPSMYAGMQAKRPGGAMLGDTSMGMINGYFGPQRLARVGFSEHKIDQAWVIEQGKGVGPRRVDDALAFVRERGVEFHYGDDFDERATRVSSATTARCSICSVSSGPIASAGSTSSVSSGPCRSPISPRVCSTRRAGPRSDGSTIATTTEADQGNLLPMEMLKRLLRATGLRRWSRSTMCGGAGSTTAASSGCC